jgi:aminoglycoside phosphotransferase (APT) family kinase protein
VVHGIDTSEQTPFGGPFFVMDRLPGDSPNVWRRGERAVLERDWHGERLIASDFVTYLARIHAVDAAGVVAPQSFRGTVARWRAVQEEMQLVRDPVVESAYEWVLSREPNPVPPRLVHGDYRIGNCLIAGGRISGILDWELAYVGDPRFDLAYTSLGWYSGNFVMPGSQLLGAVAESDWFHERYAELVGFETDPEVEQTLAVLGGLMLFGILVTGVRLYRDGRTSDIRMAWSRFVLATLRQDFARLMRW